MLSALKKLTLAAVAMATLSACYLPARFDAEVEVTRAGYYSMIFDGYLAHVTLYDKLRKGEITEAEEQEWIERLRRDLVRPSADPRFQSPVKEFKYFKQGHFKVNWTKEGDLTKTKSVYFLRRNEHILALKFIRNDMRLSTKKGLPPELVKGPFIIFEGKSIKKENKTRLVESGLGTEGTIRLKTDTKVYDHNATRNYKDKTDPNHTWYVWEIKSIFAPTPKAVMQLR